MGIISSSLHVRKAEITWHTDIARASSIQWEFKAVTRTAIYVEMPTSKALLAKNTYPTASTSVESIALSKDLKKLGWKFVGPTRAYAFIQAMGLINDHVSDCVIRSKVERVRKSFQRPCKDK